MKRLKQEPQISVGIIEDTDLVRGRLHGAFNIDGRTLAADDFRATAGRGQVALLRQSGEVIGQGPRIIVAGSSGATFDLFDVTIGKSFHWERPESHSYTGSLVLQAVADETLVAINEIPVEDYLISVISSEMNALAPAEFLKAHAILSRSWLLAALEKKRANVVPDAERGLKNAASAMEASESITEIVRWYDREDHELFDVCADDHCQRYHGVTKIISDEAVRAVEATRGIVLTHEGAICDARYSKACGGYTELYPTAWDDKEVAYLANVCDAPLSHPPVSTEEAVKAWITSAPEAYCNTTDRELLSVLLPDFDRETIAFFRWTVNYTQDELSAIIREKSGIDFGKILALTPLSRGPSGRIYRLLIEGTKKRLVVGKELEIRRWLSRSHLFSSAFVIETRGGPHGEPERFTFHGAGWGHGVGLCQIGAAVMATKGFTADQILAHYFRKTEIARVY